MLLVGDIHISSKIKDKLIDSIKFFIDQNSLENDIVFLGDYIYHFIYDRTAILQFFEMLLHYYAMGKNIYVLAGNHDYIDGNFVFQEALKSFDILNSYNDKNKLLFITKPQFVQIQGNDILFLPYSFDIECNEDLKFHDVSIANLYELLSNSKNKNENISAKLNRYIYEQIADFGVKNNGKKLFIFHHYYFAGVSFPGQLAKFNYKDIAISDLFFDQPNVYFVSGHLHQGFAYKNYFCTGSVWNSSPLEQNQFKFLYTFDPETLEMNGYSLTINPYYTITYDVEISKSENKSSGLFDQLEPNVVAQNQVNNPLKITTSFLENQILEIFNKNKENYKNSCFTVNLNLDPKFKLSDINLTILSKDLSYDNLSESIDENLINSIKDIRIKKAEIRLDSIINMLDTSNKDLKNSISDWKSLLLQYLEQKFGQGSKEYVNKLKELKLL